MDVEPARAGRNEEVAVGTSTEVLGTQIPQAPAENARGVPEVKSAVRTLQVLEHLAARQGRTASVRDVAEMLGAPRSSAYALLRTLVQHGWVRADESGTMYTLGIQSLLVGTAFLDSDPYVRAVRPVLTALGERLSETVHLARLDGDGVVYLATQESRKDVRTFSRVGRRLPSHATGLGKAILAERPDAVPDVLTPLTERTIVDPHLLADELTETRARGYAIDDGEGTPGLRCFAFALHYTDPVRDAISCSIPTERLDPEREAEVLRAMDEAHQRIEQAAPREGSF